MKSYAIAAVLSSVMMAGPAMADNDFRALGKVSSLKPMTEGQLSAVEGGILFPFKKDHDRKLNVGNVNQNIAVTTITAVNLALGKGGANQNIVAVTQQSIGGK
ncbi:MULTISPECIES: hypothetical protein [Methylocaldum]|jgi:hypothetical protein|uniref:hypothetical protein n=1 Tax=unclassified Methylocaldum TaxID=2622260 RepID=UPI00098AE63B|nr:MULTISPECIES: hypothetical protein [unclassified Methylocaldum]MBP1149835.1 hypothetical protein [Methylocaldum sp. RMAD-M]MDV3243167.1 hypothetical protein [Methylocaldum sp.]MVF22218.1 hypothetical protein [Methylocaldum sp. BRCS4]